MKVFLILLLVLFGLVLLGAYVCFYLTFSVSRKMKAVTEDFVIPPGKIYEPHRDTMVAWMKEMRQMPHEEVSITSFDGLRLYGLYYECKPGAPIEILFHGYRGSAERDLCGGVQRCFALGRNALIVDQRTSGKSEGHVITFGIHESRDCLTWVDFVVDRFGPDTKIILTGISMGASTVLLAGGMDLPKNVVCILADCGYTSARAIIKKVIRQLRLPPDLLYPLVRLGARLYGGFDPEERSPREAVKDCHVPVIFIHGEDDDFVPCDMSRENYNACSGPKILFTVPGAGHGLSYILDGEGYLRTLQEFSLEHGI